MDPEKKALADPIPRGYTTHILVVAIAIITTALVIMSVLGGLYVHKLESHCEKDAGTKQTQYDEHYNYKSDDDKEEVDVDNDNKIEKYVRKDQNGHILSVVILDFEKRLLAAYLPDRDQCYLHGGIDKDIGSFDNTIDFLLKNQNADEATESTTLRFFVLDDTPVKDKSLLPQDLEQFCESHELFWIEKDTADIDREKRGIRIRIRISIRITISF